MDAFQKMLARAMQQLRGLSISQRASIFMGGALVALALAWMTQWAAQPDMTPLLPQNLSGDELARITSGLDSMGEPYKTSGSQVLVRADANKPALLARLTQSEHMPADTSIGFAALIKESNPWVSQEENDRRWTVALQAELEKVLRQLNGVKAAHVLLNLHQRKGFSREAPTSSASVTLVMQGGDSVPKPLARAAARIVSGAVRGVPLRSVQVVDANGVAALDWEQDDPGATGAISQQRRDHERAYADKIRSQLAFDPRVRVNVQVELDLTTRASEVVTPTEPVDVFEDRKTETTTKSRPAGQPGVQPNVGLAAAGSARDENTSIESSKTERITGNRRTTESKPSGEVQSVFAAVNISYSYLAGVFRREGGGDKPTTEQIQQIFEREKARVLSQVAVLVKPQTEEQVRVDWYYDQLEEPVGTTSTAGSLDETFDLARQYGPQAGLGLLALISLTMMLRLSKRSGASESFGMELGLPKEAIEAARKAAQDVAQVAAQQKANRAQGRDDDGLMQFETAQPIGRAAGMDGVLEAREVDERTIQISKMIDQLGEMISGDREAVAGVLEHWARAKE